MAQPHHAPRVDATPEIECALLDAANRAYRLARTEVFDRQPAGLSPRQQEILAELEGAEEALAEFRLHRREGLQAGS